MFPLQSSVVGFLVGPVVGLVVGFLVGLVVGFLVGLVVGNITQQGCIGYRPLGGGHNGPPPPHCHLFSGKNNRIKDANVYTQCE